MLVLRALGLLLFLGALGSGPALRLGGHVRSRLVLALLLGPALAASLLTTCAFLMPLRLAAWFVLVPATAISVAFAVVLLRRSGGLELGELAFPAVAITAALSIALLPSLVRGTDGPFGLAVYDAWGYSASSLWLLDHRAEDAAPSGSATNDLTVDYGRALGGTGHTRIGVDAIDAGMSALFGIDTAGMLVPLLAVLFALVSLSTWLVARNLGASRLAAAIASLFVLTPGILTIVQDTALANIAAISLVPVALLFVMKGATRLRWEDAIVAGLLLAGLIAVYPEFLPSFCLIAAIGGVVLATERIRRRELGAWLVSLLSQIGIASVTVVLVAPYALFVAIRYLKQLRGDDAWSNSLPPRWLSVQDVGAWTFGLLHLYELPSFTVLSPLRQGFAIYFPVVLVALVLMGVLARLPRNAVFVAGPIAVAVGIGVYSLRRYQGGDCQYCLWKSLTQTIPFVAVGLALGIDRLVSGDRRRGWAIVSRWSVFAVVSVTLIAIGRSDLKLIRQTLEVGAYVPGDLRALGSALDGLPRGSNLLIEGVGALPSPKFALPAAYYVARGHGVSVSFSSSPTAPQYLGTALSSYTPGYDYVLSPYGSVHAGRSDLGRYGPFMLQRRAPLDVALTPIAPSLDSARPGVLWVSSPLELRISSAQALDAALELTITRSPGSESTLGLVRSGLPVPTEVSGAGTRICADVRLRAGATPVVVAPALDPLMVPSPPGKVEEGLGIVSVRARPGHCRDASAGAILAFGSGWNPVEVWGDGTPARWMGQLGVIEAGTPGQERPQLRINGLVTSFQWPRRVVVSAGGSRLATLAVPASGFVPFSVVVPPGHGVAQLVLTPDPLAGSAAAVNPADQRMLSVAVTDVALRAVTAGRR